MRIITFTFLCFFLISCVLSLQYPAAVDRKIRKSLLDALKRFHRNDPAPCIIKPVLSPMHSVKLEDLTVDLMNQEVGSFLDLKSMINLRKTSINSKKLSDSMLKFRLAKFSHHFVFDDFLLNVLFKNVLDKHFPESSNLSSPFIKDEMQVLILKLNYGGLNYDLVPRNIYFYLISFIYEFVNGPNSLVPISKDLCLLDSIRLVCRKDFPRTLDYIRTLGFGAKFYEILDLLLDGPSKDEVIQKVGIVDLSDWRYSLVFKRFGNALKVLVAEIIIDDVLTDQLLEFINSGLDLWQLCGHSSIIMGRILSELGNDRLNILSMRNLIRNISFDSMHSFCAQNPTISPDCELVLKRTLRDLPLDETESTSIELSDIENILNLFGHFKSSISLYQAELFSQCINSPLLSLERHSFHSRMMTYEIKSFFLEIYLKENTRPFNSFFNSIGPLLYIYKADLASLSILTELLNSRDPIVLLRLMSKESIIASKRYIIDKFDLNKTYCISSMHLLLDFYPRLHSSRTVHFKQIIQEQNCPELQQAFSSNPHEFKGNFLPSEPIIPVNEQYQIEWFK
jgi:hypothetical protein